MLKIIEVLAGDFPKGNDSQFVGGKVHMKVAGKFFREGVPVAQIAELQIATEENTKSFWRTIGVGLGAGWLLGPIGFAAGF